MRKFVGQIFFSLLLSSMGRAVEIAGQFQSVQGEVLLTTGATQTAARIGAPVHPADTIQTNSDGHAKIVMKDRNVFLLEPNSKLLIETYTSQTAQRPPEVTLQAEGEIHATVNAHYDDEQSTFRLKTPTAVAGVRGTEFVVNATSEETKMTTLSGVVTLGTSMTGRKIEAAQTIPAGHQSVATTKGVSAPRKLAPKELATLKSKGTAPASGAATTGEANKSHSSTKTQKKKHN